MPQKAAGPAAAGLGNRRGYGPARVSTSPPIVPGYARAWSRSPAPRGHRLMVCAASGCESTTARGWTPNSGPSWRQLPGGSGDATGGPIRASTGCRCVPRAATVHSPLAMRRLTRPARPACTPSRSGSHPSPPKLPTPAAPRCAPSTALPPGPEPVPALPPVASRREAERLPKCDGFSAEPAQVASGAS
jgi:hypothetical protein